MQTVNNKFLSFILSLVLALGIWLYVITVVSPESQDTFKNIPVEMQNVSYLEERGLMITSISHTSVSLRLSGNRTDLIRLNSENIRVTADVFNIHEPGVHEVPYTVAYPGTIPNGAIEIQSRSPDTIQVVVERKITKKLDIEVNYKGSVANGFSEDRANVQLDTNIVTVSGPESILNNVSSARIYIDVSGRTETFTAFCSVTIYDTSGAVVSADTVSADINSVKVTLQVKMFKEVPLVFDNVYGGGATESNTTVSISHPTIKIAGHKNLIEGITQITVGKLDLAQIPNNTQKVFNISLPEGVSNESGIHEVTVTVSYRGLVTKQLDVSNFQAVSVPQGMSVLFSTEVLTVTLRGPEEDLSELSAEDIIVSVDFTNYREGTFTVSAVIVLPESVTTVGAVNSYPVSANIFKA